MIIENNKIKSASIAENDFKPSANIDEALKSDLRLLTLTHSVRPLNKKYFAFKKLFKKVFEKAQQKAFSKLKQPVDDLNINSSSQILNIN